MFSGEVQHQVWLEQRQDRLREMERQQLLQQIKPQRSAGLVSFRLALNWLGSQMVRWGLRLQDYGASSLTAAVRKSH